jgi:hypothetical protein
MKIIKFILFSLLLSTTFLSCDGNDSMPDVPQKRDYQDQYNEDIAKIENYLKTHAITVVTNPGFADDQNATYSVVPSLDANSIWGTDPLVPKVNVLTKIAIVGGVEHKIYYLKFRDGVGASPNTSNQIKAYYNFVLLNDASTPIETSSEAGVNLQLNKLILGWKYILPEFKMGTITGINQYNDFGAGVMFLPSALAYYEQSSANVPAYSPVIFNIKLFNIF